MNEDRGAARDARDQGIQQAIDHADFKIPKWSDRALEILRCYIRKPGVGEFTAEDVRAYADKVGLPEPPHLRAWGGVFQRASRNAWIERAGVTQARAAHVHCGIITVWRRAGTVQGNDREALLEQLLRDLLEMTPEPPEKNCSCHLAPPCSDCVDWSGLRELIEQAERVLDGER